MNKHLCFFALLLAAPVFAANNIKMVTYFPVPYASYNDLGVTGTCDVGLLDNCELDSGSSLKVFKRGGDGGPLNTGALTVKGGSLDLQSAALNSKISGVGLSAGRTGSIGTGTLEFKHDLEVNTMPGVIQSVEATNKAVLEKLKLINEDFPGCDAKDNEISWKRLTINDKSGVFLVCGLGEKTRIECSGDASEKCGCNNQGTRTRTCNYDTGKWSDWGACSVKDCGCSDQSYKLANKQECCPSTPKNDTDCWKIDWVRECLDLGECYQTQPDPPWCDPGTCNYSRLGTATCEQYYCNGPEERCVSVCSAIPVGWRE